MIFLASCARIFLAVVVMNSATLLLIEAQGGASADSEILLTATAVRQDLDAFRREFEGRFSYLRANQVDYRAAIEGVYARAGQGLTVQQLGIELQQIISLFIDGHAGVRGFSYPKGYLPFLLGVSGERVVGFHADRSALLDAAHPYVAALDGRPLQEWLRAVERHSPKGSPQYRRFRGLRLLRNLQFMRAQLGLPARDVVTVELKSADGKDARTMTLPIAARRPEYGDWPMRDSQLLDENIGYLRLTEMADYAADLVNKWMHYFKDTRGLIVDVRSNAGGTRHAVRALFPYFMKGDDEPLVNNVAVYRLYERYESNHLAKDHFMYPEAYPHWTPAERAAISRLASIWAPEWRPPSGAFSNWHYMVLSRRLNPQAYFYFKPVVVLLDDGSFSATDIFVSSLKGWRNVTLVGTPSEVGARTPRSASCRTRN